MTSRSDAEPAAGAEFWRRELAAADAAVLALSMSAPMSAWDAAMERCRVAEARLSSFSTETETS